MTSSVSLPPMLPSLADAGFDRINRHCVYYYGSKVAREVTCMPSEFDRTTSGSCVFYFGFESCKGSCSECEDTIDQIVVCRHPALRGVSKMYQALHSKVMNQNVCKSCYCISISRSRLLRILSSSHQPGSRAWKASASHKS